MRELIDVRLPLDPGAPWMARRVVEDLPARFHDRLETVQLAVSELVTNALVHADPDAMDEIRLVAREEHGRLRVEVIGPADGHDAAVSGWRATAGAVSAERLPDSNEASSSCAPSRTGPAFCGTTGWWPGSSWTP